MDIYALVPFFAALAYIGLLATTVSSRPRSAQQRLFSLFLVPAVLWSLSDFLLRSDFLDQHNLLLGKVIVFMFTWLAVQFHVFTSSFFSPGEGRWLPLAYTSLAVVFAAAALGYIPRSIVADGGKLYPVYGPAILLVMVPLLALLARNVYVFTRKLRTVTSPVFHNQIISILMALFSLTVFTLASLAPWLRELPLAHLGGIINALILSYAVVRHQLVDIRFVLRRGVAWASLAVLGGVSYWLLLEVLHVVLNLRLHFPTVAMATAAAIIVALAATHLRVVLLVGLDKAFHGRSYGYRQKLSDFAGQIHNVFTLKEQGVELLRLVTRAVDCKRASLLFPETGSGDFTTQMVEPKGAGNPLHGFSFRTGNPVLDYLGRAQKILTREDLAIMAEFRGLWELEKEEISSSGIELLMPLISRERLIGVLALSRKKSGQYTLEDLRLLENVTRLVAVSVEKEYLREQLREREAELSIINRLSTIISSNLNIEQSFSGFITELKKSIAVEWAAIVLIEGEECHVMALHSEIDSPFQVGQRAPLKDTLQECIEEHRQLIVQHELSQPATSCERLLHERGLRSLICLPLLVQGKAIGSFIAGTSLPNAYNQRQVLLLDRLSHHVVMPVENSRLYAQVEERSRVDELTGLLNRRSMDEAIAAEVERHERYGGTFSVIAVDLDSLKQFNDSYGHPAGDNLLRQIAALMKGAIRSTDRAFRYGGDEFLILLPQTSTRSAHQVADRVRRVISTHQDSGQIAVTASLGLASWPEDGAGGAEVIAAADAAQYQAKRAGGNSIRLASWPGDEACPAEVIIATGATPEQAEHAGSRSRAPAVPRDAQPAGSNGGCRAGLNVVFDLAAAVDAREHPDRRHSNRVKEYAVAIGRALALDEEEVRHLGMAALLHDIGKIGVSHDLLHSPDKLNEAAWKVMKGHPQLGATIAGHFQQLAPCVPGILYHHEKYDGSGYPMSLKGEEIPLQARILAIADAFAAMTSDRPYSQALSWTEALEEIRRGAGERYDPHLVELFLSMAGELKSGQIVSEEVDRVNEQPYARRHS